VTVILKLGDIELGGKRNKWMNEWMNEWTNEWMNEWIYVDAGRFVVLKDNGDGKEEKHFY